MWALQRFFNDEFGVQDGVSPSKRDATPGSGCIEKDDPFPATWICRFDDFKLGGFVFHGRSSKSPAREFHNLPRNSRLHVKPQHQTFATTAAVALTVQVEFRKQPHEFSTS